MATAILLLAGCSAEVASPPDPNQPLIDEREVGQPPKPGPQNAGDGEGVVLAVDRLYLGETDWARKSVSGAWKQFGLNIDGKVSGTASRDLCKPAGGATPADVYSDGDDGIDNSFGKLLLPLLFPFTENAPSTQVSDTINNGEFTVMVKIEALGEDTSYNPLKAKLYGGAKLSEPPKWDGTDKWPVLSDLLERPEDIESAKVVFPQSYVVDNTWVSGSKGEFQLNLSISGNNVALTISGATIVMELSDDHTRVERGTIAGVLETERLVSELEKVAGAINQSFCGNQTIVTAVRRASDILKDGTQDPSQECNAISIGIGFTAKVVQLGDVAAPVAAAQDPCAAAEDGGS